MKRVASRERASVKAGVLDAGAVLARLDRRRRGHATVVDLLERCRRNELALHMSVVNLAESLEHGREYAAATGLDVVTLLAAYHVQVHRPDVDVARRVARLATLEDASLGDRFALATADILRARLFTTDTTLAGHCARVQVPATRL